MNVTSPSSGLADFSEHDPVEGVAFDLKSDVLGAPVYRPGFDAGGRPVLLVGLAEVATRLVPAPSTPEPPGDVDRLLAAFDDDEDDDFTADDEDADDEEDDDEEEEDDFDDEEDEFDDEDDDEEDEDLDDEEDEDLDDEDDN